MSGDAVDLFQILAHDTMRPLLTEYFAHLGLIVAKLPDEMQIKGAPPVYGVFPTNELVEYGVMVREGHIDELRNAPDQPLLDERAPRDER